MNIGVDIGGTGIKAGLVDDQMRIVRRAGIATRSSRSAEEVIASTGQMIQKLISDAGLSLSEVTPIGLGCPGTVDTATGNILFSNNLGWHNVPLVDLLKKQLGTDRILVDNDANCAALGEVAAGAAKGCSSCILLTLGTGVGGGIIIDKKIYAGFNHAGAELGHMVIVSGGELCTCGRRGCLESYASATALMRMGMEYAGKYPKSKLAEAAAKKAAAGSRLGGQDIFAAAAQGDEAASKAVSEYVFYLGEGITNLVNIFQPEKVLLGGGVSAAGEQLLEPLRRQVARDVFCKEVPLPEIAVATLGNDAGIIGAACLS